MIIFGAGMAGLLAAHMLRRYKPVCYEKQATLPDNHKALLRFRSDAVAMAAGIPFRRVEVTKALYYRGHFRRDCTVAMNNEYSYKTTGEYSARSIGDLQPGVRWIAPPDFVERLAEGTKIEFNTAANSNSLGMRRGGWLMPYISTLPMPVLMNFAEKPPNSISPKSFRYRTIWTITADITSPKTLLYQTIYYPAMQERGFYRASITGARVILEFSDVERNLTGLGAHDQSSFLMQAMDDFGMGRAGMVNVELKEQRFGKIMPIDEQERRAFIVAMSDRHRIYSLGRFATWRPKVMLDDLVQDIRKIEMFIDDRSRYSERLNG